MSKLVFWLLPPILHTTAFRLLEARCLLLHSYMLLLEPRHKSDGHHTYRNLS